MEGHREPDETYPTCTPAGQWVCSNKQDTGGKRGSQSAAKAAGVVSEKGMSLRSRKSRASGRRVLKVFKTLSPSQKTAVLSKVAFDYYMDRQYYAEYRFLYVGLKWKSMWGFSGVRR